jgi:hypothetical protein
VLPGQAGHRRAVLRGVAAVERRREAAVEAHTSGGGAGGVNHSQAAPYLLGGDLSRTTTELHSAAQALQGSVILAPPRVFWVHKAAF